MFSIAGGSKPRYFCTRENLIAVILLAKEKIGNSNLLDFYVERVNTTKDVSKYLNDVTKNPNIDKYANFIIEYLNKFKLDLVSEIKKHNSIEKYINSLNEKVNSDL